MNHKKTTFFLRISPVQPRCQPSTARLADNALTMKSMISLISLLSMDIAPRAYRDAWNCIISVIQDCQRGRNALPENEESAPVSTKPSKRLRLVEMETTYFRTSDGRAVNLMHATPQEFDDFLSRYVVIEDVDRSKWPLLIRWRAINFALKQAKPPEFCQAPQRHETTA